MPKPSEIIDGFVDQIATYRADELDKSTEAEFLRITGTTRENTIEVMKHDPKTWILAITMFLDKKEAGDA